jgi:hypothetical protein
LGADRPISGKMTFLQVSSRGFQICGQSGTSSCDCVRMQYSWPSALPFGVGLSASPVHIFED